MTGCRDDEFVVVKGSLVSPVMRWIPSQPKTQGCLRRSEEDTYGKQQDQGETA